MDNKIFLLNPKCQKKSILDAAYFNYIDKLVKTLNDEDENRWEIYSIIIEQLLREEKTNYLKEIKYRISDGENPNVVFLDILDREGENIDGTVWFFKRRIEEYLEDDYFKRFTL